MDSTKISKADLSKIDLTTLYDFANTVRKPMNSPIYGGGIYCTNKKAISTNGHLLAIANISYPKKLEGRIYDPYTEKISERIELYTHLNRVTDVKFNLEEKAKEAKKRGDEEVSLIGSEKVLTAYLLRVVALLKKVRVKTIAVQFADNLIAFKTTGLYIYLALRILVD